MRNTSLQLNIALKEWSVTIDALASGNQIFLLRKGGIREANRHFEIVHRRFLLYPTHFHEAELLLKPDFRHLIGSQDHVASDSVLITSWAEVTDVLSVDDAASLAALSGLHVWTDEFVSKRIAWKPLHPADLIVLKTHRLDVPERVKIESHHKGCKSWVDFESAIDTTGSTPALSDLEWDKRAQEIRDLLSEKHLKPVPTA